MKILYYKDEKLEQMKPFHLESLVSLVKQVWDNEATVESYLAARAKKFAQNPLMKEYGYPITLLVDNDDKVVGQCNSIPCKIWAGQKELVMFWNAGLHLLPECRGKGLGLVLPEELTRRLPIISGFFVVPQQLRTHEKLGFHIVGKIPDFVKVYNPSRFLDKIDLDGIAQIPRFIKKLLKKKNGMFRKPSLWTGAVLISLVQLVKQRQGGRFKDEIIFSIVDEFDVRVDDLWDKIKNSIKFAQVRSSVYMNWQFKASQGWKKIIMEEKGELVGYALVALRKNDENDKLADLRVISTIDLVWDFDKTYVLDHYFRYFDSLANQSEADIAFCSINDKLAVRCLQAHGYSRIPSSVYFVVRSQLKDVHLSACMDDWFLTRGDADAAGSLEPNI